MKLKLDQRGIAPIFIFVISAFILAILAAGGVWYWYDKEIKEQNQKTEQEALAIKKKEEEKKKVPEDFEKITLNETDVFYPSSWGTYEKETTKEDFSIEGNLYPIFSGEMATFGGYINTLHVNNMKSYENYSGLSETVSLLKKVYSDKKIDSSEKYGYLPAVNAAVNSYNPRYVQNNDGNWRGYWFLANITQGYSPKISFVAVMYNKDKNKVVTINATVKSAKSDELDNKLVQSKGNNLEAIGKEISEYIKNAYEKDKEVKDTVDNIMLKVCNFVK